MIVFLSSGRSFYTPLCRSVGWSVKNLTYGKTLTRRGDSVRPELTQVYLGLLLYSSTVKGLEEQIGKLMKLCKRINLKLSPAKFSLSEAVKFGGVIISAEKIKDQSIIFLDPPGARILVLTESTARRPKKSFRACVAW